MKQTQNYQLNQWELTDRIRMEDFNGDNAKIDAALKSQADALAAETAARANADAAASTAQEAETAARKDADAALREENQRVWLMDKTTTEDTTYLEVSLDDIDLTPYQRLEVVADVKCGNTVYMKIKNHSSYDLMSLNSSSSTSVDYCARCAQDANGNAQIWAQLLERPNNRLLCVSLSHGSNEFQIFSTLCSRKLSQLPGLAFCGPYSNGYYPTVSAGTRIRIYGIKR